MQSKGARLGMDPKNPSSLIVYAPRSSVFAFHFTLKPMLCGSRVTALWLFPTPGTISIIDFYGTTMRIWVLVCHLFQLLLRHWVIKQSLWTASPKAFSTNPLSLQEIAMRYFLRPCSWVQISTETHAACMQIFLEWHWTILSPAGHFVSVHATLLIGQRSHFINVPNLALRQVFFPCFTLNLSLHQVNRQM